MGLVCPWVRARGMGGQGRGGMGLAATYCLPCPCCWVGTPLLVLGVLGLRVWRASGRFPLHGYPGGVGVFANSRRAGGMRPRRFRREIMIRPSRMRLSTLADLLMRSQHDVGSSTRTNPSGHASEGDGLTISKVELCRDR